MDLKKKEVIWKISMVTIFPFPPHPPPAFLEQSFLESLDHNWYVIVSATG